MTPNRPENVTEPETAQAKWVLGLLPSTDLPGLAADWLEQGIDTVTLRQLAGLAASHADAGRFFERALRELGRAEMTREEAGRVLVEHYARQIVAGVLAPYEGACTIAGLVVGWDDGPREAFPFYRLKDFLDQLLDENLQGARHYLRDQESPAELVAERARQAREDLEREVVQEARVLSRQRLVE